MKNVKRILAGLLAVSCIATVQPYTAQAANTQSQLVYKCQDLNIQDGMVDVTSDELIEALQKRIGKVSNFDHAFAIDEKPDIRVYVYDTPYTKGNDIKRTNYCFIAYTHLNTISIETGSVDEVFEQLLEYTDSKGMDRNDLYEKKHIIFYEQGNNSCIIKGKNKVTAEFAEGFKKFLEEKDDAPEISGFEFQQGHADLEQLIISLRYPYSACEKLKDILKECNVNESDYYMQWNDYVIEDNDDSSKGFIGLGFDETKVSQKQCLDIWLKAYEKLGYSGYSMMDNANFRSEEEIEAYKFTPDDKFLDSRTNEHSSTSHIRESGLEVQENNFFDNKLTEITDEKIKNFYLGMFDVNNKDNLYVAFEKEGTDYKIYAYDDVLYDNSLINGAWCNRKELNNTVYLAKETNSILDIYVRISEKQSNDFTEYLNKKYDLPSKNINISFLNQGSGENMIRISGMHYDLTEDMADKLFIEYKEKFQVQSGHIWLHNLSDGITAESLYKSAEYPLSAKKEVEDIIKKSGLNVNTCNCIHYNDNNGYFDLLFDDVYNTTQMDVAKLRAEIYFETGLTGIPDKDATRPDLKGLLQFKLTNSVAQPGGTTYIDITLGRNTGFYSMLQQLEYDRENLELASISLKNGLNKGNCDFSFNQKNGYMSILSKLTSASSNNGNLVLSDEDVIRLAFKVKDSAPEGDYEIKLQPAPNEESGVISYTGFGLEYVKSEYTSGNIKVSKTDKPKTEVKPLPLSRTYAQFKNGDKDIKSSVSGDTDNNGSLNSADALNMKKYFLNMKSEISNADTNEDGVVNIVDMLILNDYLSSAE